MPEGKVDWLVLILASAVGVIVTAFGVYTALTGGAYS